MEEKQSVQNTSLPDSQAIQPETQKVSSGPKKSKSWLIIIGIILLILIAGLTYFLIKQNKAEKIYHVGVLRVSGDFSPIFDSFKTKMTELGYVEGKNVLYEDLITSPAVSLADAQVLAKKLVDAKVDLIFTYPTPLTVAAHNITKNTKTPVVFTMCTLEGLNLINTIREPGGQMTGVRYPGPEMVSKRLELLTEIAPKAKRVWVGYDKNNPNTTPSIELLRSKAASLGVALVEVSAATLKDFEADLAARAASKDLGIDAIVAMNDGLNQGPDGFAMIVKFATDHKLPLADGALSTVQRGAVIGNSPSLTDVGELSAPLADKILKGIKVGTIPIVTPEQEIYINYKVAQELGLKIPEGLLTIATKIIR